MRKHLNHRGGYCHCKNPPKKNKRLEDGFSLSNLQVKHLKLHSQWLGLRRVSVADALRL